MRGRRERDSSKRDVVLRWYRGHSRLCAGVWIDQYDAQREGLALKADSDRIQIVSRRIERHSEADRPAQHRRELVGGGLAVDGDDLLHRTASTFAASAPPGHSVELW